MQRLLRDYLDGRVTRRGFMRRLVATGFTAAAARTVLDAAEVGATERAAKAGVPFKGTGGELLVEQVRAAGTKYIFSNAMTFFHRLALSVTFVALAVARLPAGESPTLTALPTRPDALTITVLTYDYAGVPSSILLGAEEEAIRVYREIGLELVWRAARGRHQATALTNTGSGFMVAMIITSVLVADFSSREDAMGLAPKSAQGDGWIAYVFYPHIETTARRYNTSIAPILGPVFAHEIGHLLLPLNAHSYEGLMRGDWNSAHVRHAIDGTLRFTAEQAELIRGTMSEALAVPRSADGFIRRGRVDHDRAIDAPRAAEER